MQKKILVSYIVIILLAIGISATTFWNTGYEYIKEDNANQYVKQADLIADAFILTDIESENDYSLFVHEFSKKYNVRITIIDIGGNVIVDSDAHGKLENHADRTEVIGALAGEKSAVVRYSTTLEREYFYSAIPVEKDNFTGMVRVAIPFAEVSEFNTSIIYSIVRALVVCISIA